MKSVNTNNNSLNPRASSDSLLTKKDLSLLLNVSVKMIDRKVALREIPFLKIGRLVRFDRAKIQNWLDMKSKAE